MHPLGCGGHRPPPASHEFLQRGGWQGRQAGRRTADTVLVTGRRRYCCEPGERRRISAYLDIPVNEALWPTLWHSATFNAMKANAEKMAPASTIGLWKDTAGFFHSGTNRRWDGVLTGDQIARYRQLVAERLEPQLAQWLEHGRQAPLAVTTDHACNQG